MAKYLLTSSFGNDSVALIQLALNKGLDFEVVYNDTGWARKDWPKRVALFSSWLMEKGITLHITKSIGMAELVKKKKGWPMPASKMQFCTQELKEKPTEELLNKIDPDCELIIVTGRRREESQNRADLPLWQHESPKHGGRDVWNPLINHDEKQRDELIKQTGFEVLPHSSMECYPCVCANKDDLAQLLETPDRIDEIERLEIEMGFTRNQKPRVMFRPYRVGNGVGIRQAVLWGAGARGYKSGFIPNEYKIAGEQCLMFEGISDIAYEINTREGREFARQCDGGFCGN
ncbi:phosphoadenosine phosphosulfate reductase family protein [Pseudoalteromonas spongiae]|uniref:phosphoadenosine phosphosulfate reductase family protein n=1 Tax=Pseudoalteromonas spongiae TaxID=298657 RepID=UPI000C2D5823|nr:phosphoadenosine phosphosulfate reductase family protein [Pseudoalteromonas spongiae]